MIKFEYKKPRVKNGDLRTQVIFYEYEPKKGPEPGEVKKKILYKSWAKIEQVWAKDLEQAKSTGTVEDLTITIRDPQASYRPTNLHYIEINSNEYKNKHFNVKHIQPEMQNNDFIKIVAGLKS